MTGTRGIPTARAIDHYAFTVPDLEDAVALFTEVFGAGVCYREGPIEHSEGDWMERKLGVHPRSSARIAMLRFAGSNLELFEYTAVEQNRIYPAPHQPGGHYIALTTTDRARVIEELRARPGVLLSVPAGPELSVQAEEPVWLRTSWGMHLAITDSAARVAGELQPGIVPARASGPESFRIDHVGYTVADLSAAESFFVDVLGAQSLAREKKPVGGRVLERVMVRAGPTANIALLGAGAGTEAIRPPRNSDVGGHHLAVYVDDVDIAAAYLARQRGVDVMGTPETVTYGPISGDRWVYFRTPVGLQMEIINMPDGTLPYERTTSVRRAVPPAMYDWTGRG